MNDEVKAQLEERNNRIIAAVLAKAERVCSGAVEMIAVTGSFHSGNAYEKSDLDLLIVIGNETGHKIAHCFILEDTAHDIYCYTWEQLGEIAEYRNPHVIKLLDVGIVYCKDNAAMEKYRVLSVKLKAKLEKTFDRHDLQKVKLHYDTALQMFAKMCIETKFAKHRLYAARMLQAIEYTVYMLNKTYIKNGIRDIPKEICALEKLPRDFEKNYAALICAIDRLESEAAAKRLLRSLDELISETERELCGKREATAEGLRGSYEEIYSNWKNKISDAAEKENYYLSLMTMADCQSFYDEMYASFDIPHFDLFKGKASLHPSGAAAQFNRVMKDYRRLYDEVLLDVCRYDSIEDFEKDYLK